MKMYILFAVFLILHASCGKDEPSPLVSTDFEGKFVIVMVEDPTKYSGYTIDQNGLTQVLFDSIDIYYQDVKWIRNGQFIYSNRFQYYGPSYASRCTPQVFQPDGTIIQDFKSDLGWVLQSSISPAGNHLVSLKYSPYLSIYSLDHAFHPILLDSVGSSYYSSIAWAPDGERFLFEKPGDTAEFGVAVYDLPTRSVIPIFEYSYQGYGLHSPDWSADGNRISFIANNILYIGDAQGLGTTPISVETQEVRDAAWSSTTHELAYARWSPDKKSTEIVIYDPISETRTLLSDTEALGLILFHLIWSKDGNSIAFYGSGISQKGVFIIRRDGTDIRKIYNVDNGNITSIDWHED